MSTTKIGFQTFFDFDDDSEINKALKQIDTIEKALKNMIDAILASNARLSGDMLGVQGAADGLAKTVGGLNLALDKNQKIIADSAAQSENLVQEYNAIKTVQSDNTKQVAALNTQLTNLQATKQQVINANVAEGASIASLKKQLDAAEAEYVKFGSAADNAVKQDQIDKIKTLNTQYTASKKVLDQAKKSVDVAVGSYTQFSKQVADAKKKLKDMEGSLNGSSQEFKDLKKFVAEGTATLKDWDKSIGDNQRNVGDYAGALKDLKAQLKAAKDEMIGIAATLGEDSDEFKEAAIRAGEINDKLKDTAEITNAVTGEPIERFTGSLGLLKNKLLSLDFKGANSAIKQLGAASKELTFKDASKGIAEFGKGIAQFGKILLTNPIFLLVAAIALVVIGINKLKDVIKPLTVAFDAVGQAINLVIDAVKTFSDYLGLSAFQAEEYADRVIKAYDEAQAKITDYYDNEIKVANAAGANTVLLELRKQQAIQATAQAQIKALDDFKKTNAESTKGMFVALDLATNGLASVVAKALNIQTTYENKLSDEQQAAYDKAQKALLDSNAEIKAIEVKYYNDLLKMQDEHNDKTADLDAQLAKIKLEIAERQQQQIVDIEANGYVARNAASVKAQNIRIKMAKDEADQEIAILKRQMRNLEEQKDAALRLTQDNASQIQTALAQAQKMELLEVGANAKKRAEIIQRYADKAASLTVTNAQLQQEVEQKYAAQEANLQAEIAQQVVIINTKKEDQITQIKRKGVIERKQITIDELNQEIEHNKSIVDDILISYDSRVRALMENGDLEEKLLKAQLDAKLITQTQYQDKVRESEEKLTNDLIAIFNERAERLAGIEQNKADVGTDKELIALNESLKNRETSLVKFNLRKKIIEDTGAIDALQRQIKLYQDERDEQAKFGKDTTEKEKQIADVEKQISDIKTAYEIDGRQKVHDAAISLMNDAFSAASQIIQNESDVRQAQYEAQIQALSDKKDRELAIVGDDAQAKAIIEQNFANQQKKIQQQANADKRKAAIYQKAINIVQATTNTALAVTEALGSTIPPFSFILAGLVAAAGAVQIAQIASQQIPSFFKGTQYSPEGLVRVAERGPEAIISPKGEVSIAEKEQIIHVERGSKILTAQKTASLLDDAKRYDEWNNMNQITGANSQSSEMLRSSSDYFTLLALNKMTNAVQENTAEVTSAIHAIPQPVYDEKGFGLYERTKNARILRLGKKYKF